MVVMLIEMMKVIVVMLVTVMVVMVLVVIVLVMLRLMIVITRRYGPLRGPTSSSCGGLRPSDDVFFALRAKKELIMLFWPFFGDFWCPVALLLVRQCRALRITEASNPLNQKC